MFLMVIARRYVLILLCSLAGFFLAHFSVSAKSSIIRLNIIPGTFTYAGPATLMFSTSINESASGQTLEEEFL